MAVVQSNSRTVREKANSDVRSAISLSGVTKSYFSSGFKNLVLEDINLTVAEGELVAICGFSGSGKTTLAKIIAGLVKVDSGQVNVYDREVLGTHRDCGIVFQNYSLLPWLTVWGNVALSVDSTFPDWVKSDRDNHIRRFIDLVGLSHATNRYPRELSGGMKQRTSLARTLAMKPKVLVLDEPLSALDALTRSNLQDEILKIWDEERQTCVLITNDVDEAILMADRIIPLNPGPGATLGPCFNVSLQRPRRKTELNHNDEFKQLRNSITKYLINVRDDARVLKAEPATNAAKTLPDLRPIHDRDQRIHI